MLNLKYLSDSCLVRNRKGIFLFLAGNSALYEIDCASGSEFSDVQLSELANLISAKIENENQKTLKQRGLPNTSVSALNLNLTDKCNLACVYCYAKGGNYSRIMREMSPEDSVKAVRNAFMASDIKRDFRVEFFGGEPLLNFPAFEAASDELSEIEKSLNGNRKIVRRVSTNLTELTPEMLEFFSKVPFIFSVSIDGDQLAQNSQRPFKNGSPSWEPIIENLEKIREVCPESIIVARITVYQQDKRLYEIVNEIADKNLFDYASIYPAAVEGENHFTAAFRENYLKIAQNYSKLLSRGRFSGILELNRFCEGILGRKVALNHCRAGNGYFTASPDGSVHPCHRLVGDESWNLGSFDISEKLLSQWQVKVDERQKCSECQIRYFCGGGCRQESLKSTGSLVGNSPKICAFSKLLFEAAMNVCTSINEVSESKLYKFSKISEELFVFCGQPLADRMQPDTIFPETIDFHGSVMRLKRICFKC
ncbi:MAG: SPASM domain-containing protein [Candidatus Riflebacteria bacterium]|nr:SPASM domain-containing protein [Candidatus Riflebacteria bacterium]